MSDISMALTQQWLREATAHKMGLRQGLYSAWNKYTLSADQLVKPGHLGIERRLSIYAGGYSARLLECMRADYSSLCYLLGDELFNTFALAYIMERPSRSYTLFDLGQGFPEFLNKTKPVDDSIAYTIKDRILLPIEVARLERQRVEVIRCRGHEQEPEQDVELLLMTDSNLQLSHTARLLHFNFPMIELMQVLDHQEDIPAIKADPCHIVIWRHSFRIQMQQLENWQYDFLSFCSSNRSFYQSAQLVAKKRGENIGAVLARLYIWLPLFLQRGLLRHESQGDK